MTVTDITAMPGMLRLGAGWSIEPDAEGHGAFLRMLPATSAAYVEQPLGTLPAQQRFTCLHRFSPFWTRPATGDAVSQVPAETLFFLSRSDDATSFTLIVPLLDGPCRYALRGGDAGLMVTAETGDADIACTDGIAVFIASGSDPYSLVTDAARSVQRRLDIGRLRVDKPVPDTVDLFGWCTWDAFYKDVTPDKVLAGLASFERAGVQPRLLILDDGWQDWRQAASGEDRLVSMAPNARFGGSLAALADAVKRRFGIERLVVWHALLGYWGGLDEAAFARFGTRTVAKSFGPGLAAQDPPWDGATWGTAMGVPSRDRLAAFFDALHESLAKQGVDGVKVDAQALLESVSAGQGGRVAMARAAREALDASVARHFDGRLVNCMSCTTECAYLAAGSTVMRSSDDFFPDRPGSHGLHLHVNAMASLWFGEFMLPDWDMFQSAHPRGAFHAAARAVSGGPVYVSDRIDAHDAALLAKLVLSDGTVLRADGPGRPTPDTLFADPTRDPVPLKIFNRNRDCAVVGLFNAGSAEVKAVTGPGDVPGWTVDGCVAWSHRGDQLWQPDRDKAPLFTLAVGEWELVSMAPIEHDFAALGLAEKFNSSGAIVSREWVGSTCHLALRDGGSFLAWSARRPDAVRCDDTAASFNHDAATGRLHIELPRGGPRSLTVQWAH